MFFSFEIFMGATLNIQNKTINSYFWTILFLIIYNNRDNNKHGRKLSNKFFFCVVNIKKSYECITVVKNFDDIFNVFFQPEKCFSCKKSAEGNQVGANLDKFLINCY